MGKPTIVVLEAGGIVDMSQWYANAKAVVMAWYPGMLGGIALGRLLFGDANFSGKLPVTWDTNVSHWPTFANSSGSTTMEYWVGYQYFDHNGTTLTPSQGSFPFGYGLSYTTFSYENLQVPCSTVKPDGEVAVTVDVYNQSAVAGTETVFLFVQYPGSVGHQPGRPELQGAEGLLSRFAGRQGEHGRGEAHHDSAAREGPEVLGHHPEQMGHRARSGEGRSSRRTPTRRRPCARTARAWVAGSPTRSWWLNNQTGPNERTITRSQHPFTRTSARRSSRASSPLRGWDGARQRRRPVRR